MPHPNAGFLFDVSKLTQKNYIIINLYLYLQSLTNFGAGSCLSKRFFKPFAAIYTPKKTNKFGDQPWFFLFKSTPLSPRSSGFQLVGCPHKTTPSSTGTGALAPYSQRPWHFGLSSLPPLLTPEVGCKGFTNMG